MPNPVTYAENTLGVHTVYAEAQAAAAEAEDARRSLVDATAELRSIREALAQREAAIISEVWGKNPDASQSHLDRLLKVAVQDDQEMTELRRQQREMHFLQERAESAVKTGQAKVELLTARLLELGSLLAFYAARTAS